METESQAVPEEVIEETITPDTTEVTETVETAPEGTETVETTEVETPTFEPNYMFKVHGQEKEFDEWAKP